MSINRHKKTGVIMLLLAMMTLFIWQCKNEVTGTTQQSDWLNVYDTNVHYVGMPTCITCHQSVHATFSQTGMGQSFDWATPKKSAAYFGAHVAIYDSALNLYYKPYWVDSTLYIQEYRLDGKDTLHSYTQAIDYIIGSGQHTNSHLYNLNGYVYQAPITYYTQKKQWDLAPGFEKGASSRFSRIIEAECMTCHNALPQMDKEAPNRYVNIHNGIDCERCHGPGSLHVQKMSEGKTVDTNKSADYSIVNPRRLPIQLQNDVCQRCHLQGIAVLAEDKTFFDYRPGMPLSNVSTVFMPLYEGADDQMIMASHVERMKMSACFLNGPSLSCISCHKPHVSVKQTPISQYNNACINCHKTVNTLPCQKTRTQDNCVSCHMPKTGSIDIPHVAVTDHYIRKPNNPNSSKHKVARFLGLKSYNNDAPDDLTIAKGYLEFYERFNPIDVLLDSAASYLEKLSPASSSIDDPITRAHIRLAFLKKNYTTIIDIANKADNSLHAWTAYHVSESYHQLNQLDKALQWAEVLVKLQSKNLDFLHHRVLIFIKLKNWNAASEACQKIIELNPKYAKAWASWAFSQLQMGNEIKAIQYYKQAVALDPVTMSYQYNLAIAYRQSGDVINAKKTLEKLLRNKPDEERAKAMLSEL